MGDGRGGPSVRTIVAACSDSKYFNVDGILGGDAAECSRPSHNSCSIDGSKCSCLPIYVKCASRTGIYLQPIGHIGGSLDQLRRKGDYAKKDDGFLFFATSLYHLPLFVLYYFEMFFCSKCFLAKLGGHAFYDLYLSLAPFGLCYAVIAEREQKTGNDVKKKGD